MARRLVNEPRLRKKKVDIFRNKIWKVKVKKNILDVFGYNDYS